jgi:protein-tyrosine phosphatase
MIDFHNHLMPGVDDGAVDLEEARTGLGVLRDQRIHTLITTPHLRGSMIHRQAELDAYLAALDAAWAALQELATTEFPEMQVERGAEVMLDVPRPDLSDARLRLAGTSFVLLEFPFMSVPPHSNLAIRNLAAEGWVPVIAHPERYRNMTLSSGLIDDWRDSGARIQVNSGSLLGQYGTIPRNIAWALLGRGSVDYLSSDYHSRGKCAVAECAKILEKSGAHEQLVMLTVTNPSRLLNNELPESVMPLEEQAAPLWKRLLPWS